VILQQIRDAAAHHFMVVDQEHREYHCTASIRLRPCWNNNCDY
jgi:hypothetical protein